jgi:hypothetical protein
MHPGTNLVRPTREIWLAANFNANLVLIDDMSTDAPRFPQWSFRCNGFSKCLSEVSEHIFQYVG